MRDERQIRTPENNVLIGYIGDYRGARVLAIMEGTDERTWRCRDIINIHQLLKQLESGPSINLDNLI